MTFGGTGPELPRDHPLAGCEAKFWRAHSHFEILHDKITSEYGTGELDFVTFVGELKPDAEDVFRYVISEIRSPDLSYATLIGGIVHNLCSALDQLVFELAFLGTRGAVIPEKVAYPSSTTRQNWNSDYVQGTLLAGVLKKHRALIYRTQPCYRRQDAASGRTKRQRRPQALEDLHNLWNHDKHRMLQAVHMVPLNMRFQTGAPRDCVLTGTPTFNQQFFLGPLKVGAELLTIPIRKTGVDPYVDVQIKGTGQIGFQNRIPVLQGLADMGTVVEVILSRFTREFETPVARRLWGASRGGWIERPRNAVVKTWIAATDDPTERPDWVTAVEW